MSPSTLLCLLALTSPLLAQSTGHVDPEAEAAARRLRAANVAADVRIGRGTVTPLPASTPAVATPAVLTPAPGGILAATVADWPTAPTVRPRLEIPVQAIFLANDDGLEPCSITPAQVDSWVAAANAIWAQADIELVFDSSASSTDHFTLKSTLLNEMTGESWDPNWPAAKSLADAYAALFPGRMVVFFRYGHELAPTGGGFSWTSMDFVAMPGFPVTKVCGVQNIGLLAHELGHHLGLAHTFAKEFASHAEADAYHIAGGTGPTNDVMNGDGRDETEADPFIRGAPSECDPAVTTVALTGKVYDLPKDNVMSYYHPISEVVACQQATARQVWALRHGTPMHETVFGGITTYEAEHLGGTITGGSWNNQWMGSFLGKWSNDTQLVWLDASLGDSMSLDFPAGGGGKYDVYVGLTAASDYCVVEPRLNGVALPWVNLYSSLVLPTGLVWLGTHTLPPGTSTLSLTAITNDLRCGNPRQGVGVDCIVLASPSTAATETVRLGLPPNADALTPGAFGPPVVGEYWRPDVDHTTFVPDATVDVLALSTGTANLWIGFEGTLLVDLSQTFAYEVRHPALSFWLMVPYDPAFVGLGIHTQAGSLSAQGHFKLTNALDLVIGSY